MYVRSKNKKQIKCGRPEVFSEQTGAKEPLQYTLSVEYILIGVCGLIQRGGYFIVASQNIVASFFDLVGR